MTKVMVSLATILILLLATTSVYAVGRDRLPDVTYRGVKCETYRVECRPLARIIIKYYFSKKYRTIVYAKVTDEYENTISILENVRVK